MARGRENTRRKEEETKEKETPKFVEKGEKTTEPKTPEGAQPRATGIQIFEHPSHRVMEPGAQGPGFHQSMFDKRRSNYDGIHFLGDYMFWAFTDGCTSAKTHNPWFQTGASAHDPNHPLWISDTMKDPYAGTPKYYTELASGNHDTEWAVHSIHSHMVWYIKTHWNHVKNMSLDDLRYMCFAYIMTNIIMVQGILKLMNLLKGGSPEMKAKALTMLPDGGSTPSRSLLFDLIRDYFNKIPMAWPLRWWKDFNAGRAAWISRTTNKQDGMIIPINDMICCLAYRYIAAESGYYDPIKRLHDLDLYSTYAEYFLPMLCGLNPSECNIEDFIIPGAFDASFQPWLSPRYEPILTSPSLYYHKLLEYHHSSTASVAGGKSVRYTCTAGTGYCEAESSPTYNAVGALRMKFESVRPSDFTLYDDLIDLRGERILLANPGLAVAPGGILNDAIELWFAHKVSRPIIFPTEGTNWSMDHPIYTSEYKDASGWKPQNPRTYFEKKIPAYRHFVTGDYDEIICQYEDLLKDLTDQPELGNSGVRSRGIRYPNFTDFFPDSLLISDPECPNPSSPTIDTPIPRRWTDLVRSIESWMNLYVFVSNPRKTGEIVRVT